MWRGAAAALLGLALAWLLRRGFEPRARLLSAAELRRYRGAPGEPGLYLALLGRVFDVERGHKHYGPGGAYSGLAGRDASRAFASGDFTPAGLVDDVSGLSPPELLSIHSWLSFYRDNYEPVGKLVGRFYDENGAPTEALREAEAAIEGALKFQAEDEQKKQQFPPCNSEWSSAKGTRFWCSRQRCVVTCEVPPEKALCCAAEGCDSSSSNGNMDCSSWSLSEGQSLEQQ